MLTSLFAFLCRFPVLKRLLWRRWYQFLARRFAIPEWQTMNYGYSALPAPAPIALDPAEEGERYGLQLYHAVCASRSLEKMHVLEVGCGRGGGAAFLHRAGRPAAMTGLDFSAEAIALCKTRYPREGLTFLVGDAEKLPFPPASFDIVVNVESSHCYGSLPAFLAEVRRVLKPGGHFLCADFRDDDKVADWRKQMEASGLIITAAEEITPNVLAALDADNDRKLVLMHRILPKSLYASFSDFAAVKGSLVYEHFRTGRMKYWRFELTRPND
jgi:ubiquinone/menaquinone biosynthesis C-methylase UbiE